jgi:hypothetical protein
LIFFAVLSAATPHQQSVVDFAEDHCVDFVARAISLFIAFSRDASPA